MASRADRAGGRDFDDCVWGAGCGPNPAFSGRDLFDLSTAAEPQISPDGRTIAYVRRQADIMTDRMVPSIWLVDVATGAERPLVAVKGAHSSPRWSPNGSRLAYVSTMEGSTAQLFVRWMASGEAARITSLPDSPNSVDWSPDGSQIAYVMSVPDDGTKLGSAPPKPEGAEWAKPLKVIDKVTYRNDGSGYVKPGFNQLFVVSATGGAPRQLTYGAFHHGGPLDWTPDSRSPSSVPTGAPTGSATRAIRKSIRSMRQAARWPR